MPLRCFNPNFRPYCFAQSRAIGALVSAGMAQAGRRIFVPRLLALSDAPFKGGQLLDEGEFEPAPVLPRIRELRRARWAIVQDIP